MIAQAEAARGHRYMQEEFTVSTPLVEDTRLLMTAVVIDGVWVRTAYAVAYDGVVYRLEASGPALEATESHANITQAPAEHLENTEALNGSESKAV